MNSICSGYICTFIKALYLVRLKTALPQPLYSPQYLLQWQLELASCEEHLHLLVLYIHGVIVELCSTVSMV